MDKHKFEIKKYILLYERESCKKYLIHIFSLLIYENSAKKQTVRRGYVGKTQSYYVKVDYFFILSI